MSMTFDTKIAIVLCDDLETWQKLNVTAFVASAVVGKTGEILGAPYQDAAGNQYLPMVIQPIMIYQASAQELVRVYQRAREREVKLAIFTRELFSTGNDDDNRAAVADKLPEQLDLVGVAMRDLKKTVDKVTKGLKFHP
ncbi:DUF2000 family protein [Aggregatilinea lenta]|uniref:DUF2000 family protein n=1 Tax=Aggregatilinea lenta TaxID=913108 RepID=UPI001EE85084|nr:DUF2000 family protein [Aggregatilinea lenta]